MGDWILITASPEVIQDLKRAMDKYNIIPQLFSKKSWDLYTIKSVGMGNDCMLSFMF